MSDRWRGASVLVCIATFVAAHWLPVPGVDADLLRGAWSSPLGTPYFGVLPGLLLWLVGIRFARAYAERERPRPGAARLAAAAWLLITIPGALFSALWLESASDEGWELGTLGVVREPGLQFRLVAILARCAGAALVWQLAEWIRRTERVSGTLALVGAAMGLELLATVLESARDASATGAIGMAGALAIAALALAAPPLVARARPPAAWPVRIANGLSPRSPLDLALAALVVGTVAATNGLALLDAITPELSGAPARIVIWCAALVTSACAGALAWLRYAARAPSSVVRAPAFAAWSVPLLVGLLAPVGIAAWLETGARAQHPWTGEQRLEAIVVSPTPSAQRDAEVLAARLERAEIDGVVEALGPARIRIELDGVRGADVVRELLVPGRFGVHAVVDEPSAVVPGTVRVPRAGSIAAHLEGRETDLARAPAPPGLSRAIERSDEDEERCSAWVIEPPGLTNEHVAGADVLVDAMDSVPYVSLRLTEEGTERFAELTSRHVREQLAIVVDGRALTVPVVQQRIDTDRVQITLGGWLDFDETAALAESLADGLAVGAALRGDWTVESITQR